MKKNYSIDKNKTIFIDLFFILSIFILPIILKIGFKISTVNTRVVFILSIAIWGLVRCLTSQIKLKSISYLDIGVFVFTLYTIFQFYYFSDVPLYYYKYWIYISYLFLFYLFRWFLCDYKTNTSLVLKIGLTLVVCGILQSIFAILQYFEIFSVTNPYFSLLGSFTSPNFLGAYVSLCLVVLVWYFVIIKTKKKVLKITGLLAVLLFIFALTLSKSRGSWLSILISLIVLFSTLKQTKKFLSKISVFQKTITILFFLCLSFICFKYLYQLKPESIQSRAFIAKISLQEIIKEPLGHGLFAFTKDYNKAKASYFELTERPWEEIKIGSYAFSPFNDYILIGFELGIIGLILVFIFIFYIILNMKINKYTQLGLAIFVFTIVFAICNAILSSVLLVSVGMFGTSLIINNSEFKGILKTSTKPVRTMIKPLIFISSSILIYISILKFINQTKFENYSLNDGTSQEMNYLFKFMNYDKKSGIKRSNKFYKANYPEEGLRALEETFEQTSQPSVGRKLAYNYFRLKEYEKAEEIFEFNKNSEPYRYQARMDLITLYKRIKNYGKLVSISKEVIDLPIKISSKKIDRYKNQARQNIKKYERFLSGLSSKKTIDSKILNRELPYKVYFPPNYITNTKLPVIYINDGYSYISKGQLHTKLDSLILNNKIKPIVAVFLEPKDIKQDNKNIRQKLFLCNPLFVDFFSNEFLPLIESKYPISNIQKDRSVLGVSFGGLAAAYLADQLPNHFNNIIMQSPAFHPCPEIYKLYNTKPKRDFNFYLSYGTSKDTEKQNLPFIKILNDKQYNLKVDIIKNGNHNWENWSKQIEDILLYFYQKKADV